MCSVILLINHKTTEYVLPVFRDRIGIGKNFLAAKTFNLIKIIEFDAFISNNLHIKISYQ